MNALQLRACDNCGEPIDDNGEILCPTCKPQPRTVYQSKGYKNREDYLNALAEELDIDSQLVHAAADLLGPSEDFDGLVNLEDYADSLDSSYTQEFDDFTDADPGL